MHPHMLRNDPRDKIRVLFLPAQKLFLLHWSFHFRFESASFVWVTLPQARAEQLACVGKLLMGTREDVRMSREPPFFLFFLFFLFFVLHPGAQWHKGGLPLGIHAACCWTVVLSYFYPFRNMMWAHIHLYVSWSWCTSVVWPLPFCSCFISSEWPWVCERRWIKDHMWGDVMDLLLF